MLCDVVVLGDLVLCGLFNTGSDELLVKQGIGSLNSNWDRGFCSCNDVEVGLDWVDISK